MKLELSRQKTIGGASKLVPSPLYKLAREAWRGELIDPAWIFVVLQYLEKILPSIYGPWCALQDLLNIMGCLGPLTSSKMVTKMAIVLDFTKN